MNTLRPEDLDELYPEDPTSFVILWMMSPASRLVALTMDRPLAEVLEWADNLIEAGVELPDRPVWPPTTPPELN